MLSNYTKKKKKKQHSVSKIDDIITRKKACYQKHSEMHIHKQTGMHTHTPTHTIAELLGWGGAEERKQELLLIKILCGQMSFQPSL